MDYRRKSLVYLLAFLLAAFAYYLSDQTGQQPRQQTASHALPPSAEADPAF